jgi:hypothetical protein
MSLCIGSKRAAAHFQRGSQHASDLKEECGLSVKEERRRQVLIWPTFFQEGQERHLIQLILLNNFWLWCALHHLVKVLETSC